MQLFNNSPKHSSLLYRNLPRARGFTLLEVMVALFILSVTAAALSRVASQSTNNIQQLELRQHAQWVAQKQLSLILLQEEKNLDGETEFGGYEYYWKSAQASTELAEFKKVTITVSQVGQTDYQLAELVGFAHAK